MTAVNQTEQQLRTFANDPRIVLDVSDTEARMIVAALDVSHALQDALDSTPEAVAHVEGLRDRIVRVLSERAGVTVDEASS